MDRRQFLVGLFGTAAAAIVIPKAVLAAPEDFFINRARHFAALMAKASAEPEIWCDGKDYSFSPLPGFRPMRGESDEFARNVLSKLWEEFDAPPK
jgi:hypothetical protein